MKIAYDKIRAGDVSAKVPGRRFSREDAAALVAHFNANEFDGWFSRNGRYESDVLAIFQIESGFDPDAIGDLHLPDKSWGIGQVRGSTAADFGVLNATALLDPATGILVAMRYLKWSFDYLAGRFDRDPAISEWIGAYNAGVGNVVNGYLPESYLARWQSAAGR